jgi:AraC family L-rhamnose operon transcriptional activator RhaR
VAEAMTDLPVTVTGGRAFFTEGALAWAGRWVHDEPMEIHTHAFVEIAIVIGGAARHRSVAGEQDLQPGDAVLLQPGVWHGYDCQHLRLYNCCFSAELLQRELAWTREDPLLGHLLWTAPLSAGRRGTVATHLDDSARRDCEIHLDAIAQLRTGILGLHRSDVISRLTLVLGHLARGLVADRERAPQPGAPRHPVVVEVMRLLESQLSYAWTLGDLAEQLHVSRNYLLRLFKSATGLPPMAYLARQRVEAAAEQLLHTESSVSQIGRAVGWPDQNYFARRFKAHFGLSATEYRSRFAHRTRQLEDLRAGGRGS